MASGSERRGWAAGYRQHELAQARQAGEGENKEAHPHPRIKYGEGLILPRRRGGHVLLKS
jgi:hypothetical protein